MLAEGHRVVVSDLASGLVAVAALQQLPDNTTQGGLRPRRDRRGRPRFDRLFTRTHQPPPGDVAAALQRAGLSEPDAVWLLRAPRRGRRAASLRPAALASGLLRALWEADTTSGSYRIGRLLRLEVRPEAAEVAHAWLAARTLGDHDLRQQLTTAVPAQANAWATQQAPRLLAANAATVDERRRLVGQLCAVAAALPADGAPLSVLAADTLNDTHALDPSQPAGRLAAQLAAAIAGLDPPRSAPAVRQAWEAVGVALDPVASQLAGWHLPLAPTHPAAAAAAAYQNACQPAVLTFGLLAAAEPLIAPPPHPAATIWVVEGRSLLLAAATANVASPVVCRAGMPSVAVRRLIAAAAAAGWHIAVSADFEPQGLRGARTLLTLAGSQGRPWRLTVGDYLASPPDGTPFAATTVPDTPWDPQLATAMQRRQARVSEEARRAALLADLADPPDQPSVPNHGQSPQPAQQDTPQAARPPTAATPRGPPLQRRLPHPGRPSGDRHGAKPAAAARTATEDARRNTQLDHRIDRLEQRG